MCVFSFTKIAEAQKENVRIVPTPQVDSVEITRITSVSPVPKSFSEKLLPKLDEAVGMKVYLITEEGGGTNITTDYFDKNGEKILNVQILARNGVTFKSTIRYKTPNGKETYAVAEKTETFSNVFMIHKTTGPVDKYEFQIPTLRWKDEIRERYNLYIKYFK